MSEIEKLMKKTEMENQNKADSNVGVLVIFVFIGIFGLFVANSVVGIFGLISGIILLLVFLAIFAKPMNKKEFEDFKRKNQKSSETSTFNKSATVSTLDLNLRSDIVR